MWWRPFYDGARRRVHPPRRCRGQVRLFCGRAGGRRGSLPPQRSVVATSASASTRFLSRSSLRRHAYARWASTRSSKASTIGSGSPAGTHASPRRQTFKRQSTGADLLSESSNGVQALSAFAPFTPRPRAVTGGPDDVRAPGSGRPILVQLDDDQVVRYRCLETVKAYRHHASRWRQRSPRAIATSRTSSRAIKRRRDGP